MSLDLGVIEFAAVVLFQAFAVVRAWTILNERVKVLTSTMKLLKNELNDFNEKYEAHTAEDVELHNQQDKQIAQLESRQDSHESVTLVKMDSIKEDVASLQEGIQAILMKLSGLSTK